MARVRIAPAGSAGSAGIVRPDRRPRAVAPRRQWGRILVLAGSALLLSALLPRAARAAQVVSPVCSNGGCDGGGTHGSVAWEITGDDLVLHVVAGTGFAGWSDVRVCAPYPGPTSQADCKPHDPSLLPTSDYGVAIAQPIGATADGSDGRTYAFDRCVSDFTATVPLDDIPGGAASAEQWALHLSPLSCGVEGTDEAFAGRTTISTTTLPPTTVPPTTLPPTTVPPTTLPPTTVPAIVDPTTTLPPTTLPPTTLPPTTLPPTTLPPTTLPPTTLPPTTLPPTTLPPATLPPTTLPPTTAPAIVGPTTTVAPADPADPPALDPPSPVVAAPTERQATSSPAATASPLQVAGAVVSRPTTDTVADPATVAARPLPRTGADLRRQLAVAGLCLLLGGLALTWARPGTLGRAAQRR